MALLADGYPVTKKQAGFLYHLMKEGSLPLPSYVVSRMFDEANGKRDYVFDEYDTRAAQFLLHAITRDRKTTQVHELLHKFAPDIEPGDCAWCERFGEVDMADIMSRRSWTA